MHHPTDLHRGDNNPIFQSWATLWERTYKHSGLCLKLGTVFFLMLILLAASTNVLAANVSLAWDPKTDSGLEGYNLYYGTSSRNYDVKIPAGTQSTYTVTGLSAGTYYFAVTAYYTSGSETDFSNEVSTTVDSTPSDTSAPLLSSIQVTNVTDNWTKIIWTTSESSDTQVEFGKTTAYGSSTPLASALVNNHSVSLSGLSAFTDYHFRVKSRDAAGNIAVSPDYTFRTLLPPPVNVTLK